MARLLAVYGTLKRPYGNHRLIQDANLKFVGTAITNSSEFAMHGGGFPIVYTDEDAELGDRISVELYEFETEAQIARIDALEGHPRWYRRTEYDFTIVESEYELYGQAVKAEMYVQTDRRMNSTARWHESVTRDPETKVATWGR